MEPAKQVKLAENLAAGMSSLTQTIHCRQQESGLLVREAVALGPCLQRAGSGEQKWERAWVHISIVSAFGQAV